nr:FHA domain-containing protein [Planctomycetota bacterium]
MALLRIIDGPGSGQVFTLKAEGVTLGRDVTNPVRIDDPKSSRVHAEVALVGGRWQVKDLGSSNGTWTEAGRITSLPLVHGAVFRIGKAYLRFESREEDTLTGEGESTWADPARIEGLAGGAPRGQTSLFVRAKGKGGATGQPEERAPLERGLLERSNAYLVLLHQLVVRAAEAQGRDQLFELLDDAAAEALEGDRCAVFLPSAAPAD